MSDTLEVVSQRTPHPDAIKFTLNRNISSEGKTYQDPNTAQQVWAKEILTVSGATQLFAINNFISMTKDKASNWEQIIPRVNETLQNVFSESTKERE